MNINKNFSFLVLFMNVIQSFVLLPYESYVGMDLKPYGFHLCITALCDVYDPCYDI
jgi:hypothetical protein